MNRRQCTKFSDRLTKVLGEGTITRLGRTTGFTHRLLEVTPHRMAIALLTSLSCYSTTTLADILRVFNALADRSVRSKPFHHQLAKDAFPTFMWHLFDLLLEHLVLRVLAPVPGHALRCFDDILLQDGTSFAVVDALQDTFPGRFTKVSPAAVDLHATMSLFHDQAIRVHLAPDADGERPLLPAPGDLRRTLLLADRGYRDIDYCRRVHHAGGSFIVRFQTGINPVVVRASVGGRERPSWGGSKLAALRHRLRGRSGDLLVRWTKDDPPLRLLLIWNRTGQEHMALVTNLPSDAFTLASVRALYRLLWQIELLFQGVEVLRAPPRVPHRQSVHCRGAHLGVTRRRTPEALRRPCDRARRGRCGDLDAQCRHGHSIQSHGSLRGLVACASCRTPIP